MLGVVDGGLLVLLAPLFRVGVEFESMVWNISNILLLGSVAAG